MDWCVQVGDSCLEILKWMVPLGGVFALLTWLLPCNRGMFWWKDRWSALTDLLYWFVSPLVTRVVRTLLLAAGVALLLGGRQVGFPEIAAMPMWQQCIIILLLQDVLLYWIHRGFHSRLAWRFHAVHHSTKTLDWMSAGRFHLVNGIFSFVLADVVVLLLGFPAATLILLAPFNTMYSSMVHANLNWTFGPLRYVFASPVFHRWHHVAEGRGMNKNYASTFPILDVLFGTFYMPAGELPENFGNGEDNFPEDFWGQLIYPFFKKKTLEPVAESSPVRKAS